MGFRVRVDDLWFSSAVVVIGFTMVSLPGINDIRD